MYTMGSAILALPLAMAKLDWVFVGSTPFGKRFSHGTVGDADGRIIVAGGASSLEESGRWFNDAWALEHGEWHGLPASTWSPRGDFGFAALPNGTLVLAGGQQQDEQGHAATNDVHVLHKDAPGWERLPNAPWEPRVGHHMAACPDGSVVVTGGVAAAICVFCKAYEDVWRLSPEGEWTRITEKAPWGKRRDHRTVCLSDGSLIFSGGHYKGFQAAGDFNDIWRLSSTGEFEQLQSSAPWKPRRMFMMSAGLNDIIVVAGGVGHGDTWTVKGAASNGTLTFERQQPAFPFDATGERWEAGLAALPNNTHVLVGGMNQPHGVEGVYDDVWMLPCGTVRTSLLV